MSTCRIGIGGPVGSGKTALIEAITPKLMQRGLSVLIITNDIVTTEDAKHVRKTLKGVTDGRPHHRRRNRCVPAYRRA